jgi:hypothetical protein
MQFAMEMPARYVRRQLGSFLGGGGVEFGRGRFESTALTRRRRRQGIRMTGLLENFDWE